jgi:hypothetical protein
MNTLQLGDTLAGIELDNGESIVIQTRDGRAITIKVLQSGINHVRRGPLPYAPEMEGVISFRIRCTLEVDGRMVHLVRTIPSQENFRDPPQACGLHIWLDATADIRELLGQHGPSNTCFPTKQVRLAVWPAGGRICPQLLHPWCPLPKGSLRVEDCYRGEDVWMGPYDGNECHGGLDINHPAGTPLWTPLEIHEHAEFAKVGVDGANNNRWRGWHHWSDGTSWFIQSHHHIRLLVPEGQPIAAGVHYAEAAGVLSGAHEHTHFVFGIRRDGSDVLLDPWLLFWQMYRDHKVTQLD